MKKAHNFGSILITGGCGFIGYNLAAEIVRNHDFECIQILDEKGTLSFHDPMELYKNEKVHFLNGSILDKEAFSKCGDVDYIVHAAGFLGIQSVANESIKTLDVNILGTRNCLEFATRQLRLKKFVTFSTSEVYGPHAKHLSEDNPAVVPTTGKRWCYAASKLAAEQYTLSYAREKIFLMRS